jgi:hypothetical protein
MTSWWLIVVLVVVLAVFGLYLSMTAGRIDHLHRRIDTSVLALDSHRLRRSAVSTEIATAALLDPASSMLLADAAHRARTSADADVDDRARAESALTGALCAVLTAEDAAFVAGEPEGAAMLAELQAACRRVQLSRRFLNDAVRACRQLRGQRMARAFRLAGHTAWPETWEMDDSMPEGLVGR